MRWVNEYVGKLLGSERRCDWESPDTGNHQSPPYIVNHAYNGRGKFLRRKTIGLYPSGAPPIGSRRAPPSPRARRVSLDCVKGSHGVIGHWWTFVLVIFDLKSNRNTLLIFVDSFFFLYEIVPLILTSVYKNLFSLGLIEKFILSEE